MNFSLPPLPLRFGAALAVLALVLVGAVENVEAQGVCRFVAPTLNVNAQTLSGGARIAYVSRPHIVCDDGVRIQADSAVAYSAQNLSHLMGNVVFIDATRELRADEARYFSRQGRLQAQGNLFVRDTVQGSVIENGDMVLLRLTDFRDEEQITVRTWTDGVRPTALLFMQPDSTELELEAEEATEGEVIPEPVRTPALRDSSSISFVFPDTAAALAPEGVEVAALPEAEAVEDVASTPAPPEPDTVPYRVTGNEIFLQGNSYFRATGDVVIERDSINAYGQVAEYDQLAGRILIEQQARVESSAYDLTGRVINIAMVNGAMREIRAIRDGVLTGDDLVLTAPMILLFMDDGAMERLVAVPMEPDPDSVAAGVPVDSTMLARPVAVAEKFSMIADSLDVRSPAEILDRIIAVGAARGESHARDSLNVEDLPEIARSDWLEGDTVIATFVEVLVVDSTSATGSRADYRLDRLEAKGSARSLYRLDPADSTKVAGTDPPAVHYVLGDEILIVLLDGEVDHMDVHGRTRGFHLEPLKAEVDSLALDSLALDSLGTDSTSITDTIPPDTTVMRRSALTDPPTLAPPRGTGNRPIRPDPFTRSRRPW